MLQMYECVWGVCVTYVHAKCVEGVPVKVKFE